MRKLILVGSLLFAAIPGEAADVTANAGINSEYIFRGIPQSDGKAAAQAGLDLESSGFYLGTWGSTVDDGDSSTNDGLEVDFYAGYGFKLGEVELGVGATFYTYTDDFDDDYLEMNLSAGWQWFSLDAAIGRYENFTGPRLDYQFYAFTGELKQFYGTVGFFEDDFNGEYYEVGYRDALAVQDTHIFDYQIAIIHSTDDLLGGQDDTNIVFSLSRNFAIYSN